MAICIIWPEIVDVWLPYITIIAIIDPIAIRAEVIIKLLISNGWLLLILISIFRISLVIFRSAA
jgi:hypothetical protein